MNEFLHQVSASNWLADSAGILGGLGIGAIFLFALVIYVILAYPTYVIGQKANFANPWFAFVPILNVILLLDVAGLEIWYIVLLFVPCINGIFAIYLWYKVAEAMNKEGWVALLMLIPFVGIFVPYYIALG